MVKRHPIDSSLPTAKRFRGAQMPRLMFADPAVFIPPTAGLHGQLIAGRFFVTSPKPVGKGSGGEVWQCVDVSVSSSPVYALKQLRCDRPSREPHFAHNPAIAQNPHFAAPVFSVQDDRFPGTVFTISRFQHGGDLRHYLKSHGPVSLLAARSLMADLIIAVHELHQARHVHRDLKPDNLFFTDESATSLVIGDFGLARELPESGIMTPQMQTLWYRAPEVLLGASSYDEKVDIFSLGLIFAELLVGKPILRGTCELEQLKLVFGALGCPEQGAWPEMEQNLGMFRSNAAASQESLSDLLPFGSSASLIELISQMTDPIPSKRLSLEATLDHAFFYNEPKVQDWKASGAEAPPPPPPPSHSPYERPRPTKRRRAASAEDDI